MVNIKCIGCGKRTGRHGVPFKVCIKCESVIENWLKAREKLRKLHRSSFRIKELRFESPSGGRGDDDMADNLNSLASRLANMEEEIAWMKNILNNIANV